MGNERKSGGSTSTSEAETRYVVRQGDCVENIAAEHGLTAATIWEHGSNRGLRERRRDGAHLLPGDELFIPERRRREESAATEQRHRFRRKGVPLRFRIQLRRCGLPRADVPFRLVLDEAEHSGQTDGEGWVEAPIPPSARSGELILFPGEPHEEIIEIALGSLDPLEEISGVQGRLLNLGYDCEVTGALDEPTRIALEDFQQAEGLEVTGEPDEATRERLADVHHS